MPLTGRQLIGILRKIEESDREARKEAKKAAEAKINSKTIIELTPSECLFLFRKVIHDYSSTLRYPSAIAFEDAIEENSSLIRDLDADLEKIITESNALHEKRGYFEGVKAAELALMDVLLKNRTT